jgi:flagellin
MALTVATNTGALMAQAAASSVNKDMEMSMERLSTGKRINGASDDAAGVAIASRLTSEIRGTNQAIRNAMDGQALIDTAEGAHQEVESILQRMREVAVQAANDTNNASDRTAMATEMTQLKAEIDRIAATTTWAGQYLLNGDGADGAVSSTADATNTFNFQIASNSTGSSDTLAVAIKAIDSGSLGVAGSATQATVTVTSVTAANQSGGGAETLAFTSGAAGKFSIVALTEVSAAANQDTIVFTIEGSSFTFDAKTHGTDKGYLMTNRAASVQAVVQFIEDQNITGITVASTATAGEINITKANSLAIDTTANANTTMASIDAAILELNTQRAQLGSFSNRLDSTVSNLTNISSNLQAGRGRIEDADFAAETTSLAKSQILQQASTAMLAQANASKQNVLSLLQG